MTILSLFELPHIGLCIASFVAAIFAVFLFRYNKETPALVVLFFAAFLVRLFMAWQDPFLHMWDERVHAVVARNMMTAPFKPMLKVNPIDGYDPTCWLCSHVWLHKQPLFLWQMALSMKIFGVSEFSLRYPSVLLGSIMVVLLYQIARSVTGNRNVAVVAALLLCYSGFHLDLTSGYTGMDHNDVAFGFYVLASIWAYVRYTENNKISTALLIGLFAGGAVLTKWLTGLVVFGAWGLNILLAIRDKSTRREIVHWLLALCVCVAVFLPWQVYTFHAFPVEAAYEMKFNARHVTEVIEGHRGNNFFYIDNFASYFSEIGWFLVPAGFMVLLIRLRRKQLANPKAGIALAAIFAVIFIFFSYVVMTKIETYFFVVAPIGFLLIAMAILEVEKLIVSEGYLKTGRVVFCCLALVIIISMLNPEMIAKYHDPNNGGRQALARRTLIYKRLDKIIPANTAVVINPVPLEEFCALFYHTKVLVATTISDHTIDSLMNAGATIAAFKDHDDNKVPQRLLTYPHTFIINEDLR